MKNVHIKIRFLDPILGMSPSDPDLYMKFIASKATEKADRPVDVLDEVAAILGGQAQEEDAGASTVTVFPRTRDGDPCFWDYQIRGFCKESCQLLSRTTIVEEEPAGESANGKKKKKKKTATTLSGGVTAYKKVVDGSIFVYPRKIPIHYEGEMDLCQRPLRASTPQGERIALACSEQIPEGAWIEFDVHLFRDQDVDLLAEWMAYGEYHGMGQWRNSGKGRFEVLEFIVKNSSDGLKPKFTIQYA